MAKRWLRKWKDEGGQSLVETAVVLPILLVLFCGIIDFGWVMGNRIIAENASREGARLGCVVDTKADFSTLVRDRVMAVTPAYSHSGITVAAQLTNPSDPGAGDVKVTVTYKFRLLTPLAQTILGGQTYTATCECVMKAE